MLKHTLTVALALMLCLALGLRTAAQEALPNEDLPIGMIPGTEMTHDEFRARAEAQLSAVALNAMAYRVLNGEYPTGLYDLYNSSCWNIDVMNMFTGEPVDAIVFSPGPDDMTSSAEIGMPFDVEQSSLQAAAPQPAPQPPASGEGEEGEVAPQDPFDMSMSVEPVYFRVDPAKVRGTTPGDIFYYADGEMLQLLMYSGDGVYAEYYEVRPNGRWAAKIGLRETGQYWQQDVLAAQVLFFTGELLPQHYNHVRFMADLPLMNYTAPQQIDPWTALELAAELDIVILNPSTKQPITVAQAYSRGDFIDPPAGRNPVLLIGLHSGQASTLGQLYDAYTEPADRQGRPGRKTGPAPLGGRR